MYVGRDKYAEIVAKYSTLLIMPDDPATALEFVNELLEAEAYATEAREPTATKTVARLRQAAVDVYDIMNDVLDEHFE